MIRVKAALILKQFDKDPDYSGDKPAWETIAEPYIDTEVGDEPPQVIFHKGETYKHLIGMQYLWCSHIILPVITIVSPEDPRNHPGNCPVIK